MEHDGRVIDMLNDILTFELTIINQYWLDYRMLDHWGLPGLGAVFRDKAREEMDDADRYIERILHLDGHPNLQRLGTVQVGEDPVEHIRLALECERTAVAKLNDGIALCVEAGDNGTRELLAAALAEEEQHLDFFESQLAAVDRVGVQNYLARYVG